MILTQEQINRFWKLVNVTYKTSCWLWKNSLDKDGYGRMRIGNRRSMKAHRISWIINTGNNIEPELLVCHTCDNPTCVNPTHLFLGTSKDNTLDMIKKGRKPRLYGKDNLNTKQSKEEVELMLSEYTPGITSQKEIAKKYGVSQAQISIILNKKNRTKDVETPEYIFNPNTKIVYGEKHGAAKLTEEQVLEIRREYLTKTATQQALAIKYGVTQTLISAIVLRQIWKHI